MPKYAKTYIIQLSVLTVFLLMCIIGAINYGADSNIIAIPCFVVGGLIMAVTFNYILMNNKNKVQYKFVIKKGRHFCNKFARPVRSIIPMGKSIFHIQIEGKGIEYNFGPNDQGDVNKIFGESYGVDHHKNSMRIGWSFDPVMNTYHIYLYGYVNGQRTVKHLMELPINVFGDINFHLYIYKTKRNIYVEVRELPNVDTPYGDTLFPEDMDKKSWLLKPYFGGNRKAVDEIKFTINKLKP